MSDVVVWRVCAARHGARAFTGEGAERHGGRWSPPGLRAVYTAESRALAVVEVLVHVDDPARLSGVEWVSVAATVPAALIERPARVPEEWRALPFRPATQEFGAAWLRARRSVALRLPSVVIPGEFNYLLNPAHPDFGQVRLGRPEPFYFDPRLAP